MNAAQMLLGGAPAAPALIEGDLTLSYGELRARVVAAASAWQARGIRPGEHCVIALPDGVDWVTAFLGLIWIGALPIAVSPRTATIQLKDLVLDSGAVALLVEDEVALALAEPRAIARSDWLAALPTRAGDVAPAQAHDDAPAFLLYSSGTTGKPKGIVHAHRAVREAHVFARDILGATAQDRFYSTSKLFFAYPLANALFAGLRLGACVVLDPCWPNPEQVAAIVLRTRPTLLFSVPTLYRRMVDAGVRFDSIRVSVSAGEACPAVLAQAWHTLTGLTLVNGYGTTETLSLVLFRTASSGGAKATPLTRIAVEPALDADQRTFRLWFSHPAVALGYTREVTHDSARFGERGFSPGDLFRRSPDDDGWCFTGRSDQLLKVFGRWVDTVAIEQSLLETLQSSVRELCVVPLGTGSEHITSLQLFVVPARDDEPGVRSALEHAIAALPAFQRPSEIRFVAEFPRTETGKLRRGELAAS
ncbi:MAG: AMP-binding protein [Rhodocyclales bacterium]|nr:AMP-binding protein [Rhodocyclales bacterium]